MKKNKMNLDPNIKNLPFFLMIHIFSFNPRLKQIPNYNIIKNHLRKKYCHVCGEYIDIHNIKYYPKHIHLKYQKLYKYKNTDIYCIQRASPINILFLVSNQMPFEEFQYLKKIKYKFKIIYKKKHLKYIYNFKNILDHKNYKLDLFVNLVDLNVFKNYEFFFENDFKFIFPFLSNDKLNHYNVIELSKIQQSYSLCHQINEILNLNFNFLLYIYLILLVDYYKFILLQYLMKHDYILNFDKIPLSIYVSLIEFDYKYIEYIDCNILKKCIQNYTFKFIQLLKKNINYFFYLDINIITIYS